MEKEYRMYINGEWVTSKKGKTFSSYYPATGEPWAAMQYADEEDVSSAVEAAYNAFQSSEWSGLSQPERGRLLLKLADLLTRKENIEKIAMAETMEWGRPYKQSVTAVSIAYDYVAYFAGAADKFTGNVNSVEDTSILNYELREPLGVVAAIIPWNAPTIMAIYKIIPAITMGNTIVVKPSEFCSAPLLELARLIEQAGFPAGVVNIVTGDGITGKNLVSNKMVNKVAFTGSIETGIKIAREAASNLIPGTFELGGKSPNIVFDDANMDKAIKFASLMFKNTGQTCVAPSRLLLQENIYDDFLSRLIAECKKFRVGDPFDETVDLGPIAAQPQYEKIREYIGIGIAEGARKVLGDEDFSSGNLNENGYFIYPTIFADVKNSMRIAQEEIFGPVLSVIPFREEEEAVGIANGTRYGLAAGIWTENINRAHRLAKRLKAGTVWINNYHWFSVRTPFGGFKMSGYGRECGMEVLKEYSQLKNVIVRLY